MPTHSTSYRGLTHYRDDPVAQRADVIRRFKQSHPGLKESSVDVAKVDLASYEPPLNHFICTQQEDITDPIKAAARGYRPYSVERYKGIYNWGFLWTDEEEE